jgi:hypothetical protein
MAEYSFRKDIIEGEAGEDYIIDFLTKGWKGTLLQKKKDYTWDFKIDFENSGVQTFESKTDVYCIPSSKVNGKVIKGRDTGNIFIEFSEADWFVYYFKFLGELWMIKVQDLKKLIDENNFKIGVGGDHGSNSSGYLIPKMKFRNKFLVRINLF